MKLSIILPVHNAIDYVEATVNSIIQNTHSDYELIIIDDYSNYPTQKYIRNLTIPGKPVVRVMNDFQRWVNYNWNHGVERARGKYVAIINSDIQLSKDWDYHLIELLEQGADIACPYEKNGSFGTPYLIKSEQTRRAFRGACFMFKDKKRFFPIPKTLLHWCGDYYIAGKTDKIHFSPSSVIDHGLARSSNEVDRLKFWYVVRGDLLEYQRLTGEDMSAELRYVYQNLGISE